jgi:hypothetical protein
LLIPSFRIKGIRDENLETPAKFSESVNRWSLESISCIALDTRLGVMNDSTQDENAKLIIRVNKYYFFVFFFCIQLIFFKDDPRIFRAIIPSGCFAIALEIFSYTNIQTIAGNI